MLPKQTSAWLLSLLILHHGTCTTYAKTSKVKHASEKRALLIAFYVHATWSKFFKFQQIVKVCKRRERDAIENEDYLKAQITYWANGKKKGPKEGYLIVNFHQLFYLSCYFPYLSPHTLPLSPSTTSSILPTHHITFYNFTISWIKVTSSTIFKNCFRAYELFFLSSILVYYDNRWKQTISWMYKIWSNKVI